MANLERHHCLITGAPRGIGRATALALAADGWALTLNYHQSAEAAAALVDEIRGLGAIAQCLYADVSQPEDVATMIKNAEASLGAIEGLVCNAGIIHTQFTALTSPTAWRAVMETNLDGAFYCTKAVIRGMMRQKKGRIVYVSSDAALMGDLMRGAYSASKAGLLGLMRTVARELGTSGITVNAVAPGIIKTAMTADAPATRQAHQLAAIPMNRFGEPSEVASVIRFLLSKDASFVTGTTLAVDGGLCMSN